MPSKIFDRIIKPPRGGFSPEHARYILSLDFSPQEHKRYARLAGKAQSGRLTAQEQAALDEFLSVSAMLSILQSKARVSLSKRHLAA